MEEMLRRSLSWWERGGSRADGLGRVWEWRVLACIFISSSENQHEALFSLTCYTLTVGS